MIRLLLAYFSGVLAISSYIFHRGGDDQICIVMLIVSTTFFMAAYGMETRND